MLCPLASPDGVVKWCFTTLVQCGVHGALKIVCSVVYLDWGRDKEAVGDCARACASASELACRMLQHSGRCRATSLMKQT